MNYIIENKPLNIEFENSVISEIEDKIINKFDVTQEELSLLLDYICQEVRYKFTTDIENFSYENKCDKAQAILSYYFDDLGIKYYPCMTQHVITNDIVGHSFLVIEIEINGNIVHYLIDPTFRQFLISEKCNEKNYIEHNNMILKTPDPGYFIKDEDISKLIPFIVKGYEILSDDFAQIYGDLFYNTKTGYTTKEHKSMNGNVYKNSFIKGHERLSLTRSELEENDLLITPNTKTIKK